MARTCDEADTQPFNVVKRIVESMDLQLAPVTGPGVDGSNAQRTAKHLENARLQLVGNTERVVTWGRRLRDDPDVTDLVQRFQHGYKSCPL